MRAFRVHVDGQPPYALLSENWMSALGDTLERLGLPGTVAADCDISPDGDITVTTPRVRFRIEEVFDAVPARVSLGKTPGFVEPRLGALPLDLPEAPGGSVLDAPDPKSTSAWQAREESVENLLVALDDRASVILDAETGEQACVAGLDLLMGYVPAEAGAVLLADRRTRDLRFVAARGPRSNGLVGMPVPSGKGIAGLTVRSSVALHLHEVRQDPRHYSDVDRATGYSTHSMLSVPIRNSRQTIGCLQLLNPFAGTGFLPWHQSAAQLVAARIAARIE